MYEKLTKDLRYKAEFLRKANRDSSSIHNSFAETMSQASDVIEKLSKRETPMKIAEIHVDEYYCPACGAENNCDQGNVQDAYCPACGQRLLPEPPKEET